MPILTLTTFAPLLGAVLIAVLARGAGRDGLARGLALGATLVTLGLSLVGLARFDVSRSGYQLIERIAWTPPFEYHLGVDGLSLALILLTTALFPLCILASRSIQSRLSAYLILFLVLETTLIGVFGALDLVLFYVFFEGGLIPMFIIIGVWGGANRIYAAFKFFLYTLLGSILMLVAMVYMAVTAGTTSIPDLQQFAFAPAVQTWLWLGFFASFAVKLPMWPVHTWLPDAHVEAPTAGSVVLAAILLKLGGYGFLRFSLPMFPDASQLFTPLMFALSVVAIVYASLVAFRQTDMKKLIAYSSVAHMGFVTLGIFAGNELGVQGAIFQMISHGVISGALFLCVGVIYDRMHTREIAFYGGLVHRMPVYAVFFLLFTLGNVGLPGISGFVGEITTMTAAFQVNAWVAAGAALGLIFSAVYGLHLYRQVTYGGLVNPKLADIRDLGAVEWVWFAPLALGSLVLGFAPALVFDFTRAAAMRIVDAYGLAQALLPQG